MIKLQELTPTIYYDQSRDFQYIGRLYDLVLNAIKTEVDLMAAQPFSDNSSDDLLELLTTTFGLRLSPNKWTKAQLRAVCSAYPAALRLKGSLKSISTLVTALFAAEGISEPFYLQQSADLKQLTIRVPETFSGIGLIYELLDYVLPAGVSCEITRTLPVILEPQASTLGVRMEVSTKPQVLPAATLFKPDITIFKPDTITNPVEYPSKLTTNDLTSDLSNFNSGLLAATGLSHETEETEINQLDEETNK
jgi:hypothetical protein